MYFIWQKKKDHELSFSSARALLAGDYLCSPALDLLPPFRQTNLKTYYWVIMQCQSQLHEKTGEFVSSKRWRCKTEGCIPDRRYAEISGDDVCGVRAVCWILEIGDEVWGTDREILLEGSVLCQRRFLTWMTVPQALHSQNSQEFYRQNHRII